jgi:hypothetical protein
MAQLPEAFRRHANAPYLSDPDTRAALATGEFVVTLSESIASVRELVSIYRLRAAHLQQFTSPYGRQLASDVAEFCRCLERQDPDSTVAMSEVSLAWISTDRK